MYYDISTWKNTSVISLLSQYFWGPEQQGKWGSYVSKYLNIVNQANRQSMFLPLTLTNTPSKWPGRPNLNLEFSDFGIPCWNVATWREPAPYFSQLCISLMPKGDLCMLVRTPNAHIQSPPTPSDRWATPWAWIAPCNIVIHQGISLEKRPQGPFGHGFSGFQVPREWSTKMTQTLWLHPPFPMDPLSHSEGHSQRRVRTGLWHWVPGN